MLFTTYNKNAVIKKNIVKFTKFIGISFFPRMSLANTIHNTLKKKIIMYSPTCIKSNIIFCSNHLYYHKLQCIHLVYSHHIFLANLIQVQ